MDKRAARKTGPDAVAMTDDPMNFSERFAARPAPDWLDWSTDAALDSVVELASQVFAMPFALVTITDADMLRVKASAGIDRGALALAGSLCDLTLTLGEVTVVANTAMNSRFEGFRLVPGGPPILFYAGIPLALEDGERLGTLCVLDIAPRDFDAAQQAQLTRIAGIVTALLRQARDARVAAILAEQLAQNERLLRAEAAAAAQYKKMYDRSSELARIGVWECDLRDNSLTWTDGVYDLFELPRGSVIDREETADLYLDGSRAEMERLRAEAIRTCGSFSIDVQIRTALGKERWMRLTADVECENGTAVRLFGSKQDITQEKEHWDRIRLTAECDPLTGLANRGVFQAAFADLREWEGGADPLAALLLIDLDGFKQVNDTYGHSAGDECLRQVASRLRRTYGQAMLVARIGGDEFAILVRAPCARGLIEARVMHLLNLLHQPVLWDGQTFTISASIGIAIPENPEFYDSSALFLQADAALYAAKKAGRNGYRVFTAADTEPLRAETILRSRA